MRFIDMSGQTFGKLHAKKYLGCIVPPGRKKRIGCYECICECGEKHITSSTALRSGHSKSCGCSKDYTFGKPKRNVQHGMSRTPEYQVWIRIRRACCDVEYKEYQQYGAKGVTLHEEWKHDFLLFFSHIGKRPSPGHSIDRYPDNQGPYAPGNVRWATIKEQGRNKKTNKLIEFEGTTKTMVEWAEEFGIPYTMMKNRIRLKWSMERIKHTPRLRWKSK